MYETLFNLVQGIISSLVAFSKSLLNALNMTLFEVLNQNSTISGIIGNLLIPDTILFAKLYVVIFDVGLLVFITLAVVRIFRVLLDII